MRKSLPNFNKIVQTLSDGQFHDGSSIGEKLGISRTAVWKAIKKLNAYNIAIESQKGRGYRLLEPLILLDKTQIKRLLKNKSILLEVFESIDSTQKYSRELSSKQKIQICLAEHQTVGQGRFNRHWYSPFAENIFFSMLYPFNKELSELGGLSLITGLSIAKILEESCEPPEPIFIKWPNDLICDEKKLGGVLIEIQAEAHDFCQAIIGIGINVNMLEDKSKKINQGWTSLRKLTQTTYDRNIIMAQLINNLIVYLENFIEKGLDYFMDEWTARDYLANKPIGIKAGTQDIQGVAMGINTQGHLLIKLEETGLIKPFAAGETSVLKNSTSLS
jgi:BirA family biotin operon repressor/biotin-[acetyl-CoA-carboxylase] ligase